MEQEEYKKAIYDQLSSRRRKFIDKIGYEKWDPFQEPNHPVEIRTEYTNRTVQELIRDFFNQGENKEYSSAYRQGVYECCLGIFQADERFKGMFDYCQWYFEELKKRGVDPHTVWDS
ncbi:MAG TPA: hypothetical protein VKN82_01180 [Desulfohalobiaceae bacterium]|nr:hypothetical protein [Desulfohalobiaceae bacterium]